MSNYTEKQRLINILKEYKDNLIISRLKYGILKFDDENDRKILRRIQEFDNKQSCFGDYDILECCSQYVNLGIYLGEELIGYFGYCYYSKKFNDTFFITLIIKDSYRKSNIGNVVLKQMIAFIFGQYKSINYIYASIAINNISSQKLVLKNSFREICEEDKLFADDDYFESNGKSIKCKQYVLNRDTYNFNRKMYKKYNSIHMIK